MWLTGRHATPRSLTLFFPPNPLSSSLTLPRTIARFLDPFYTFNVAHRRVIRDFTPANPFYRECYGLREYFLLSGVFYLTLLIPREAEDFTRGDRHFKHVPPPTYLIWLSPKELYMVGSIQICEESASHSFHDKRSMLKVLFHIRLATEFDDL